jgi:hypothetical protein
MDDIQNCDSISNVIISQYNTGIESGISNITKGYNLYNKTKTKLNYVALVRERTIPTD